MVNHDYDYIVIGSGFGGSVAALRLAEKGYRVLVIEKGKRYRCQDFPPSNWRLRRWLWLPALRFFGFFKITLFRHVTVLSGVGIGGGSLVYANCFQIPDDEFFHAPSWAHLADWKQELQPFYETARRMLGATPNPRLELGDQALKELAERLGRPQDFEPTTVTVFFGEPRVTVPDPYFNGRGPEREGCRFCGGCMVGCRYNAKNSLDKNYLYFAEKLGVQLLAENKVIDVRPLGAEDGSNGYRVFWRSSTNPFSLKRNATCRGVVFAGGVLGTVPLLLKLKKRSLPRLSDCVGKFVRTNSESLLGITDYRREKVFSDGVAIGSILKTDDHSHLEPVRYPAGSGFWRILMSPMVSGRSWFVRLAQIAAAILKRPLVSLRTYFVDDWAKRTQILLFMRTLDSTLEFTRGLFGLKSAVTTGRAPNAFEPDAHTLARQYAEIVGGEPTMLITEAMLGSPTTAHILGGAVMGKDAGEGVVDRDNRVFGYQNLYVCDGSMISANPGVNPSLTITAISERAMSKIPKKAE